MNLTQITQTLESMSKEDLVKFATMLGIDRGFGIMTRNMAQTLMSDIEAGQTLVFADLCNVHAANHLYTMAGYDERVDRVLAEVRHSDTIIKWGGDEIVFIVNSGNVAEYVSRIKELMAANDIYAVFGIVTTSTSLVESVKRADAIVSVTKLMLETTGQKPSRDAEYVCLESIVVSE